MYENNYKVLKEVVAERSIIIPVSQHRKPDGTFDLEKNLTLWNNTIKRFEQIQLWENGAPDYDESIALQPQPSIIFVPTKAEGVRGTVIVAHGGGFKSRTGCEGIHIADYFVDAGFNVAILTYRLAPYTRRHAMADMHRATRLLRSRKEELNISDKIAVMGFSAGGMLSGNCATHYDFGDPNAADPIERQSCRPDAAVLGYGAFAGVAFPNGMMGRNSPFKDEDRNEKLYLSPEKNLTHDTPPFFIWQTISDDPRNCCTLAVALTEAGVPFEMHVFPDGVHGLALADGNNDLGMDIPHITHWAKLCAEWMEALGI